MITMKDSTDVESFLYLEITQQLMTPNCWDLYVAMIEYSQNVKTLPLSYQTLG
mgnify:FL=1